MRRFTLWPMDDITFRNGTAGLTAADLTGFFEGWPDPPSPTAHLAILDGSYACVLALADGRVVGFVTAISDGVIAAYIPLLEVLPEWRGRGLGRALMRRMLDALDHLYMVDLVCDPELATFYGSLGFARLAGMARRNRPALTLMRREISNVHGR